MSILVSCHCCRARDSLCSGIRAGRFWFLNASPPFKLDALISFLFCPKFPLVQLLHSCCLLLRRRLRVELVTGLISQGGQQSPRRRLPSGHGKGVNLCPLLAMVGKGWAQARPAARLDIVIQKVGGVACHGPGLGTGGTTIHSPACSFTHLTIDH